MRRVGDWVVTPRIGKAVEVNALWINALETMAEFARLLARPGEGYEKLSAKARKNFQKFWNEERGCCFDVIEAPGTGNDAALRPNQLLAVSLPVAPLTEEQQKSVVDVCAQHLLTSYGLRSLAPGDPGYQGHYVGGPQDRDAAYHQGTVWGWLLGPFVLAHLRVYGDRRKPCASSSRWAFRCTCMGSALSAKFSRVTLHSRRMGVSRRPGRLAKSCARCGKF